MIEETELKKITLESELVNWIFETSSETRTFIQDDKELKP